MIEHFYCLTMADNCLFSKQILFFQHKQCFVFFRITTLFFILAMEVCFCFRCLLKSFTVKQKSFNDAVKGFEYSFLDFI